MDQDKLKEKILEAKAIIKLNSKRKEEKEKQLTRIVDYLTGQIADSLPDDPINPEFIRSAIGHIYAEAEIVGLKIDPIYKPLISENSRYVTGRDSGRISRLTKKDRIVPQKKPEVKKTDKTKKQLIKLKSSLEEEDFKAKLRKKEKLMGALEILVSQLQNPQKPNPEKVNILYSIDEIYCLARQDKIDLDPKYIKLIPKNSDYFK